MGAQKKGAPPEIENSTDYLEHIDQAANAIYPLGMDLPIPQEVQESMNWLGNTDPSEILSFWAEQINRLMMLVRQCSSTQEQRWTLCPPEIRGDQNDFCSAAFRQLMKQYSLGGDKWIAQFIFGIPTTWNFSHEGVPPLR